MSLKTNLKHQKRRWRWGPPIVTKPKAEKQHIPSLLVSPSPKSLAKTSTKSESTKLTSSKSTKSDTTKCTAINFTFDLIELFKAVPLCWISRFDKRLKHEKLIKIFKKVSARIADGNGNGNGNDKDDNVTNFHLDPKMSTKSQ
eukprot:jgi/Psemu1/6870/gm1.6870_g